ncbi:hypothetical protein [uncultured Helicobacter sp.]|uniref:hypothetical protein n=1 Tax=uncultured Helicobacter sp. TaxID=175537 RepID=UPI003750CC9A
MKWDCVIVLDLDSVNALDSESTLDSVRFLEFRFCLCFFRISLDSAMIYNPLG